MNKFSDIYKKIKINKDKNSDFKKFKNLNFEKTDKFDNFEKTDKFDNFEKTDNLIYNNSNFDNSIFDNSNKNQNKTIKFNVGGKIFETTKSTISSSLYLSSLVSGNWRDTKDDIIFIDRDPKEFTNILRLLRDPYYPIPNKFISSLDFYGIDYDLDEKSENAFNLFVKSDKSDKSDKKNKHFIELFNNINYGLNSNYNIKNDIIYNKKQNLSNNNNQILTYKQFENSKTSYTNGYLFWETYISNPKNKYLTDTATIYDMVLLDKSDKSDKSDKNLNNIYDMCDVFYRDLNQLKQLKCYSIKNIEMIIKFNNNTNINQLKQYFKSVLIDIDRIDLNQTHSSNENNIGSISYSFDFIYNYNQILYGYKIMNYRNKTLEFMGEISLNIPMTSNNGVLAHFLNKIYVECDPSVSNKLESISFEFEFHNIGSFKRENLNEIPDLNQDLYFISTMSKYNLIECQIPDNNLNIVTPIQSNGITNNLIIYGFSDYINGQIPLRIKKIQFIYNNILVKEMTEHRILEDMYLSKIKVNEPIYYIPLGKIGFDLSEYCGVSNNKLYINLTLYQKNNLNQNLHQTTHNTIYIAIGETSFYNFKFKF